MLELLQTTINLVRHHGQPGETIPIGDPMWKRISEIIAGRSGDNGSVRVQHDV